MREELHAAFERHFARRPALAARAPGRVNLIGEHTDYEGGLVLPCAIDRDTCVLLAPRVDGRFRVWSRERGELCEFAVPARSGGWVDYVQGVVAALETRGLEPTGADLAIASEVPAGSGLSSSAALELAAVTALDAAFGWDLDARTRAEVAHAAETGLVGVPCGIMDQFASALGREDTALRLDCRSREVRYLPLPAARVALLVVHSGLEGALADGRYAERRAECAEARRRSGVAALRDLTEAGLAELDGPALRRARHVVRENARVDATCAALAAGDLARVGALLREGQASLRDDFEVSAPELDALCEIGDALPGCFGSRLTGAGFGGCTLHLVEPARAEEVSAGLAEGFAARFGRRPPVWAVRPASGGEAFALG
jgi:galactokinase